MSFDELDLKPSTVFAAFSGSLVYVLDRLVFADHPAIHKPERRGSIVLASFASLAIGMSMAIFIGQPLAHYVEADKSVEPAIVFLVGLVGLRLSLGLHVIYSRIEKNPLKWLRVIRGGGATQPTTEDRRR